ncbi:MAG: hypothetical protein N2595_09180, partial [bacterium]|nr:hypothetical protein [bacterium]
DVYKRQNEGNHGGACVVDSGSHVEFMAPEFALVIGSNRSAGVGGALWVRSYGTVTVAGVVQFVGNTSAWGGAIFATNHAVVIVVPTNGVGPVFVGNSAGLRGGAVYLMATSQLTAVNCVFRGNRAGAHGGAIANAASYARIVPNFAEAGGGIPTLFEGNRALYGGAIYGDSAPLTWVDSALIVSNVGTLEGGGIDMDNKAVGEVVNCVIIGNDANNGGGIWVSGSSSARLRHCTVVGNSYGVGSAGGPLVLSNCIVRGNTFGQVTSGHTVRYSNIEGGYPGTGNINADPLFVNAAGLDFSLKYGSPCVDAGAPAGVTWDCVGKVRPMGLGYDMGAYEQDPAPVQVVHPVVLDFGDVVIGDSSNLAVSVVNAGNSALNGAVNFVPVPTFSVSPGTYTITPQAATNVVVTFSPAIEYRWTQTVQFASNGGNTNVTLIGTGIPEPAIGMVISLILLFEAIRLTWRKGKRGLC